MRNLLGRLLDRTPQSLATIAQFWETDLRGSDAYQDVSRLYRLLTDPWAFALVWQRLDPAARAVVARLADNDVALTADELAAGDASGDELLPLLRRLYRAGLLYVESDGAEEEEISGQPARFFLPRELAHLTERLERERERGAPDGHDAGALLDWLDDGDIAEIARHLGYRVVPGVAARADMIAYLTPRLGRLDLVRAAIDGLEPGARRLWAWLERQSGTGDPVEAQAALGMTTAELRAALRALSRHGLLWRGSSEEGEPRMIVPEIIRDPRPPTPPPLPDLVPIEETVVEPLEWLPSYALAWDLLTLLREIADAGRNGGAHSPADLGSVTAQRRLAQRLWIGDDLPPTGYVPFLLSLADGLGLRGADGFGLVAERTRSWTRQSFAEQMRRLAGLWREAAGWAEAETREALQVWGADWPAFRRRLLAALNGLETERWFTIDSFVARFAAAHPDALGANFTAAASHESSEETPEARRLAVIRQAAEITLTSAVAWFGLIEVSRAHRRGSVIRSTSAARRLFGEDAPADEPALSSETLTVDPSFTVLLLRPAPRHVWALSAFTELDQLDRVSSYRLTRAGVQRGLASGVSVEQLTGYLEQQSRQPLPQNVAYEIRQWAKEYRRVRLRHALVIEPDDPAGLGAIETALSSAGFRLERIGPGRLILLLPNDLGDNAETLERVEALLHERGYSPQWPSEG